MWSPHLVFVFVYSWRRWPDCSFSPRERGEASVGVQSPAFCPRRRIGSSTKVFNIVENQLINVASRPSGNSMPHHRQNAKFVLTKSVLKTPDLQLTGTFLRHPRNPLYRSASCVPCGRHFRSNYRSYVSLATRSVASFPVAGIETERVGSSPGSWWSKLVIRARMTRDCHTTCTTHASMSGRQ